MTTRQNSRTVEATTTNKPHAPTVIIVGGGIAGLHAAVALRRDVDAAVTIIEPTAHHQFLTRLAGVAAGAQPVGDAATPLAALIPEANIVTHRAAHIDEHPDAVTVHLDNDVTLSADAVIVTAGAEPTRPPIKGWSKARPLRSAADALVIRSSLETSDGVVVVGAGATGCQLAATAAVVHPGLSITLVDGSDRVMPGFRPALGQRAASILRERGVELRLGERVVSIKRSSVVLEGSNEQVDGTVVWAGGFQAQGDAFGLGATRDGRLVIDALGRTAGSTRVFAAGDVAAHTDRRSDLRPMSAQIAAQAGRGVGANVAAYLCRKGLQALVLNDLGWIVDLGGGQGVAEVLGIPLADRFSDRLVPLLHTAIDYRNLWQLGGVSFMRAFGPGGSDTPTQGDLASDLEAFGVHLDES